MVSGHMLAQRGGGGGLGEREVLGVLDKVGGLVDQFLDGVNGFAGACVEAIAVEGGLPLEVACPQTAHFGMVLCKPEESVGGVGGLGWEFAGACKDEGVDGALGGAPGLFGGVTHVSRCKPLEGGVVHTASVGEDRCRVGRGGGHGTMIALLWDMHRLRDVGLPPLDPSRVLRVNCPTGRPYGEGTIAW